MAQEMKARPTYNGWRNYETWVTNLWITNDPETYEGAKSSFADLDLLSEERRQAADRVMEYVEDAMVVNGEAGLEADLVSHGLQYVDWDAIAEGLMEDES